MLLEDMSRGINPILISPFDFGVHLIINYHINNAMRLSVRAHEQFSCCEAIVICSNLQELLPNMSGSPISGCSKHLLYYIKHLLLCNMYSMCNTSAVSAFVAGVQACHWLTHSPIFILKSDPRTRSEDMGSNMILDPVVGCVLKQNGTLIQLHCIWRTLEVRPFGHPSLWLLVIRR